ncbi:sce7725 family protein [Oceanitalea stevensii]|uniref:Sce7725 family protein n=1 Tax=Oceanitalea stevensii TaxID=2763072 RepID=A0ABR8YZG7_9MICO|nr:sce7725 family protein [Oceanitalea stevensii]MBD8061019.1 sce7725 family protein [Oceanitalea stevensii]
MYHPYFRGKQFELIAIRESAPLLATSGFVPIIEPVRESLSGLERTLSALEMAGGECILVVNPHHGDHRKDSQYIAALVAERRNQGSSSILPGLLLRSNTPPQDALALVSAHTEERAAIIHAGFTDARLIARALTGEMPVAKNIFVAEHTNMLYRRHFMDSPRILVRDGFERKRNADYDEVDNFSDLHITHNDLGMNGYGDFLTVGDHYSEGGGPAYAVAIHLSYIDSDHDDAMFVYHFVSDTNDTPTDPAGKFGQALAKLITRLDSGNSMLLESTAIAEFRDLHSKGHFPGLGYVKKLSIKHHLETLAHFHSTEAHA